MTAIDTPADAVTDLPVDLFDATAEVAAFLDGWDVLDAPAERQVAIRAEARRIPRTRCSDCGTRAGEKHDLNCPTG